MLTNNAKIFLCVKPAMTDFFCHLGQGKEVMNTVINTNITSPYMLIWPQSLQMTNR